MRFVIVKVSNKSYWIKDTEAEKYNMPEKAISIYFGTEGRAKTACETLNSEWNRFLANPS